MKSRKWLIIIVILVLAYLAWKYLWPSSEESAEVTRDTAPELVLDRVWVDSHPERHTDHVQVMLMLSDMGLFQKASAYQMELEMFEFDRDRDEVRIRFPQTETQKAFSFKISRCDELPPFDLCLDLSANPWNGPERYYSVSDDHDVEDLQILEGELRARLRAAR